MPPNLEEDECQKVISLACVNNNSAEYIRVNGKPYAVSENSERNRVLARSSSVVSFFVLAKLFKTDTF